MVFSTFTMYFWEYGQTIFFRTVCCRETTVLIQFFFSDQIMFWSFEFFGRDWLLLSIIINPGIYEIEFRWRESIVMIQFFSLSKSVSDQPAAKRNKRGAKPSAKKPKSLVRNPNGRRVTRNNRSLSLKSLGNVGVLEPNHLQETLARNLHKLYFVIQISILVFVQISGFTTA